MGCDGLMWVTVEALSLSSRAGTNYSSIGFDFVILLRFLPLRVPSTIISSELRLFGKAAKSNE